MFKLLCFAAASLFAEQTLSIIKPDAVEKDQLGEIDAYLESSELHVVAAKMVQLTPEEAREFYAVH